MVDFFRLATGQCAGPIIVGHIHSGGRELLRAHTSVVWLSRDTLTKILTKHKDLQPEHYELLEIALAEGLAFGRPDNRAMFVLDTRERLGYRLQAVVKAEERGRRLWLVSAYKVRESQWRKLEK